MPPSAPYRCGATETSTGHPCRRRVGAPDARCYLHSEHATTAEEDDPTEEPRVGLHMTAEAFLEVLEERHREMLQAVFLRYRDVCVDDSQALKLAALYVLETDAIRALCARGHRGSAGADAEPALDVSELIDTITAYRREIRLGLHYEGHSAHHRTETAGHDNLHVLVKDGTLDEG